MKGKRGVLFTVALLILTGLAGMFALSSCESADNAAARRANAEANLVQANANAYARQVQADAAASSERASIRQMERDAAHQRALELLPYMVMIVGGLLVAGLAAWVLALRATLSARGDPALLYLKQIEIERLKRERELWRFIASLERRMLLPGEQIVSVTREDRWK